MGWWDTITIAQATIISGGMTILAGIVAAVLGGFIFGGRARKIEEAVTKIEEKIHIDLKKIEEEQLAELAKTISDLSKKSENLDSMVASLPRRVDDALDGLFEDIRVSKEKVADDLLPEPPELDVSVDEDDIRERLRDAWGSTKDLIEAISTDTKIHGKTRNRFFGMDRRNYVRFVEALNEKGLFSNPKTPIEAAKLWQSLRTGRRQIKEAHLEEMENLRQQLINENRETLLRLELVNA